MRLDKFSLVVAMSIALAGCSMLPWQGGDADKQVAEVIALCKEACKFQPSADAVAAMLAAAHPEVVGVQAVAHAICDAVNKALNEKSAPEARPCPLGAVNGVCITGEKL